MPNFTCQYEPCGQAFYSKHSTAKYCRRECSGKAIMTNPDVLKKVVGRKQLYSDADLLRLLVEQAERLGRTPTCREVSPHQWTYQQRFGSYNAAVLAAGLEPNRQLPPAMFLADRETVRLSVRFAVLQRDGFRCRYCGGTPQEGYILHVDHVIPRSKGGKAEMDNLVTACWVCNTGKSDS